MSNINPFIWQELVTPDQDTSGTFFSQLLGWSLKKVDAGEFGIYTLFQKEGQDVAGMMNPTPGSPGQGSYWHSYIAVDDVDGCAKQATELGGAVLVAPHEVPDPTGAAVHLMQPKN